MWPVATVARMAVSLRNTGMNTPLQTLEIIGGENRQLFFYFCAVLPIDKPASMWYNRSGVRRAGNECGGPTFRSDTPYAKFLRLLVTFHMRPIFPETAGGRSVRHMRQRALGFNRHMALQRYLNRSNISSCEFR